MKRLLALMLVLALCLSALSFGVLASEEEEQAGEEAAEEVEVEEETAEATEEKEAGPAEEESAEESVFESAVEEESAAPVEDGAEDKEIYVFTTEEDAIAYIREQMVARNTSFSVSYDLNQALTADTVDSYVKSIVPGMVEEAMDHTGVPNEGDYIRWNYEGYNYSYGYSFIDDGTGLLTDTVITFDFTFSYHTTAEQEAQVTAQINSILDSLNLDGKSDYEKVCAIYDWICNNVAYDDANKYNDDYTLKYTAYAALFDGKAVCQGFCNLFYQMLLECGIDNRIVYGISNPPNTDTGDEDHTWNIVNLDGVYYETDATWDINFTSSYRYFLCSNAAFSADHQRYSDYTSTAFVTAYPYATSAYIPSTAGSGTTDGTSGDASSSATGDSTVDTGTSTGAAGITPSGLAGDIDGNGLVNISDVQLLLKYVNGQSVSVVEEACDVDNSSVVNISDVQLLLKYVNGQNVTIY